MLSRQQEGDDEPGSVYPRQNETENAQGADKAAFLRHAVGKDQDRGADDQRRNDHGDSHDPRRCIDPVREVFNSLEFKIKGEPAVPGVIEKSLEVAGKILKQSE